jgi:hypothetical protein
LFPKIGSTGSEAAETRHSAVTRSRSHQGRTATQNAAMSGYKRGSRSCTSTRNPALVGP